MFAWLKMFFPACLLVAAASTVNAELLQRAVTAAQLHTNTVATVATNSWPQHLDFLDKAVLDTLPLLPKFAPAMRYKALVDDSVIGLALVQAAFVRGTFLPVWGMITNPPVAKSDDLFAPEPPRIPSLPSREFLVWFLSDRARVEEVCEMLKPQENPERVFDLWFTLWQDDPAKRDKYWRLALACALVFDKPVNYLSELGIEGQVDPRERYRYYRDASEASGLCAPIADMATWELVWVVDAPVPTSELEWARLNARLSRPEWGKAYSSIRYRMDKLTKKNSSFYDKYTLAEIRQKGGICADQAYFAAITAKANGVPAMIITGWGERGAHAWFGYEATAQDWNLKTGRYQGDKYPAGETVDPQTSARIKEPMLELLTDPQRRQPAWKTATRLVWLAEILNKHGQTKEAREALETAVAGSSRHFRAWQALCETLKRDDLPALKLQEQFRTMRTTFARYPDALATINLWELDVLKSGTNFTALTEAANRQYRELQTRSRDRTDLQTDNLKTRTTLLAEAGNVAAADKAFRQAFQAQGRNLGAFRSLSGPYADFARKYKILPAAARFLLTEFRCLPLPPDDPFAEKNYAEAERELAVILEEAGQKSTANTLRQDADQREKRAATKTR